MQRSGYRPSTVDSAIKALKALAKRTNLLNPETVKAHLASSRLTENRKQTIIDHLARFYKWKRISWDKPKWKRIETLPFIPAETEVDQLISAVDSKRGAFLQLLKESRADLERLGRSNGRTLTESGAVSESHRQRKTADHVNEGFQGAYWQCWIGYHTRGTMFSNNRDLNQSNH